jgi:hypothetical protein
VTPAFEGAVPGRYRRLVLEVVKRLPPDWAGSLSVSVKVDLATTPHGFANVHTDPKKSAAVITLFPSLLDTLSDSACSFVLAHECGHVRPVLPPRALIGSVECLYVEGRWRRTKADTARLTDLYEDAANILADRWGFTAERDAFEREIGTRKVE